MSRPIHNPRTATATDHDPVAGQAAMPAWFLVALVLAVLAGGLYFDSRGAWFSPRVYAPYSNEPQIYLYQPVSGAERFQARGKVVYEQVCALCHGLDGMGKPGQAPPFAGSEWVLTDKTGQLIRIPLNGLTGPIKVKGQEWSLAMPAMGAALPDEDLAAVLTYMRSAWGNKASEISPEEVKAIRAAVAARTQPWTADELLKVP